MDFFSHLDVHTSTFENWLGDYWHQDSEDSLDWAFLSGQTPTDDTGPLSGHGSGILKNKFKSDTLKMTKLL